MSFINDFLHDICSDYYISGYEYLENNRLINYFTPFVDSYEKDNIGSLIFKRKGTNNTKIMLVAHMDEIGLMVKGIHKDGFVSFTNIGGVDPITVVAQEVEILGKEKVYGVIGIKPLCLTESEDRKKALKFDDLYIDTGYSKEELSKLIEIGNAIGIKRTPMELMNNCFVGRGLDDKAGVAVMLETARELAKIQHKSDVYFTATAQEEVGIRGAIPVGYEIDPDIAIAIDVGFGKTPELKEEDTLELDKGIGIIVGALANPMLNKKIFEIAKKYNFDIQYDVFPEYTGCDADAVIAARTGVPTLAISVPIRYMHSNIETVNIKNIEDTGRLLARFINELDNVSMEELLCF